jgi:hypothetical protein
VDNDWPPADDVDLGRSIQRRLEPIAHLTRVRGWFIYGDVAQIGIWRYIDELSGLVSERLQGLQIDVVAQPGPGTSGSSPAE